MAREDEPAGELPQHDPSTLEFEMLTEALYRAYHLVQLHPGGFRQRRGIDWLGAQKQQRLDSPLQFGAHALSFTVAGRADSLAACDAGCSALISISPNGSSWRQVSSPCL